MRYGVKWVTDNLGITRKALRNYESKGLLSKDDSKNPTTGYREYDQKDIDRIWAIKILQGVGFSVHEIKGMMDDPGVDFYAAISGKVKDLEQEREEINRYISFAKTIKLTGHIPTVSRVGTVRFEDFIQYARENWSLHGDPDGEALQGLVDAAVRSEELDASEINLDHLEKWMDISKIFQASQRSCTMNAYFSVISALRGLGSKSEAVQAAVRLLYEYASTEFPDEASSGVFSIDFFVRYTISLFMPGSDLYLLNARNRGADACRFIAEALAYFGGYDSLDAYNNREE